jgi:TP901 family phage tail tape measure protein
MALSARELILILRATNQASGPLRQVSRDLRSLGTSGSIAAGQTGKLFSRRMWSQAALAGAIMRDTGRSARIMGIAVGAGVGFAATNYAEFQKQAGLVATQTGSINKSLGRTTAEMQRNARVIEAGVLAQMGKFPASAQEMSDALYEIFSSTELGSQGLKGVHDGLRVLLQMNRASVAGQTDLSDVTKATTSVMNAFGGGVQAIQPRLTRMFAAVRFGRMTFADFVSTFSQIVPASIAAGQSFDTMVGTMAALTRLMPNVRFAATSYARLLEIFGRKKFVEGARKFGVEMEDAKGNLRPLPQIIEAFNTRLAKMATPERNRMIRNLFKELSNQEGTIQARRALIQLLTHTGLYRQVLGQTVKDNNEFQKSFRTMAETSGVKWETFVNRMRATWIQFGAAAIPVLMELLEPVRQLAEAFNDLDKEQRQTIARWVAVGAAAAIIGGTLASVGGNLVTIIGAFKAAGRSMLLWGSTIATISAALLVLAGHGDLVREAFQNMFDFATSSALNFIATLALVTVAVVRARKAIVGTMAVAAATRAGGGALATIGAVGAALGAGAAAFGQRRQEMFNRTQGKYLQKNLGFMSRLANSGNAFKASLGASAIAAGGLSASLGPTVAIVAAIAAGAYVVDRRLDAARRRAEEFARFQREAQRPTVAARQLGGFGSAILNLRQQQINLARVNREIERNKAALGSAGAEARKDIRLNLRQLYLDRAVAVAQVESAVRNLTRTQTSLGRSVQGVANNLMAIGQREREIHGIQENLRRQGLTLGSDLVPDAIRSRVERLRREIGELRSGITGMMPAMQRGMGQALRMMERARIVPQMTRRQFQEARQVATRIAAVRGELPTVQEMRTIVRAVVDPGSLRKIPEQIRAAIGIVKFSAQVEVKRADVQNMNRRIQDAFRHREPAIAPQPAKVQVAKESLADVMAARDKLVAAFSAPIIQNIDVRPPANLQGIGAQISAGIAAGMVSVEQRVTVTKVINTIENHFKNEIEGGSPSRRFARTVGVPIMQGVIMGVLSMGGELKDAATQSIELFAGAWIQKREEKKKKLSLQDLIKDTVQQRRAVVAVNRQLAQLVARGVPMQFVEQLAQMGTEGAKKIALLAGATKSELAKMVNEWRRAQAAIQASARFNWTRLIEFVDAGAQKLLEMYTDIRDRLRDFMFGTLNDFTELGDRIADAVAGAFGEIFQGPMNISEHIGAAFDEAMKSYESSVADLNKQMLDLQEQQADIISDFLERRRDELRQAFGRLFEGPIMSAGFAAASIRDLQADLDKQLQAFRQWRADLDRLAARGLPRALLKELEELGPDARENLSILANATDEELNRYVDTWKEAQGAIEQVAQATFMDMEGFAEAMQEIAEQMAEVARQLGELKPPQRATFATLLADLQAQKDAWTDYNSILESLRVRGVPGLLIAQLAELGVEGVEILRILNSGTTEQLNAYIALWLSTQEAIKDAKAGWIDAITPTEILTGLEDQVNALAEWESALNELAARGVPAKIIAQLREMGPDALPLLRGLVAMSKEQLFGPNGFVALWEQAGVNINESTKIWMDEQIALWTAHGTNIALGIIAGIMDEQDRLLKFFRNMFKNLLMEAKKEAGERSPSRVFYDVGRNIVLGFQMGMDSMKPELAMPGTPAIGAGLGGIVGRNTVPVQMTVNAHHSESLQSTLERAAFRMRNRRPG